MPKKIATEKWSKGKKNVSSGPGYFQTGKSFKTNSKSYSASRPKKGWEKLPIISSGGEYHPASVESIYLSNTCTIDNFFQFFLVHYSMNINQMSNLFESDDPIVGNIRNIVQFLLNHDIDTAKYYWLTDICGMAPDMHKRSLSAFGTDKQMFLYPIRAIFSRTYNFTCSSDKCPAGSGSADSISDMTPHPPPPPPPPPNEGKTPNHCITNSIQEWECGSSKAALVSCKERFLEEPEHSEFVSEVDNGEVIVRCSGWRTPHQLKFNYLPPILVFDISSTFRHTITSFDHIPLEINIYDHKYNLGGISSYIAARTHYVGYLVVEGAFLFYDGLPPDRPI